MCSTAQKESSEELRELIPELCRQMYGLGWVSGTGGGISIRDRASKRVYIAPSGVCKERIESSHLFEFSEQGEQIAAPSDSLGFRPSACTPLFFNAFTCRDAGAVLHSHSHNAMLVTLLPDFKQSSEWSVEQLEMIKGIKGHTYLDRLVVPIIENTPLEHELADSMRDAIEAYPKSCAVLVRRHGVYVWGDTWQQAKAHAECYDYLFQACIEAYKISGSCDMLKPAGK
jgi:methylthioribulose-1-phosphate dehydratase